MERSDGVRVNMKPDDIICVTTPLDAESFFVDGIKGVAILNDIVRISFVENVLDTEEKKENSAIKARHVLTLVASLASLGGFLELLNKVHADIKSQQYVS